MMDKAEAAKRFKQQLIRNHKLVEDIARPDFQLSSFRQLQYWQQKRLRSSYSDLYQQDRYQAAIKFFLEELYGGKDISRRDHDVGRVYPVMVRFLPARTLAATGDAFELQAVSLELDMAMSKLWHARRSPKVLDTSAYCDLYRQIGAFDLRELQIQLISVLGLDLAVAVRTRSLNRLIRMLRVPARFAGFQSLQLFLENGLSCFLNMGDPKEFLDTICNRERSYMQAIIDGKPEPFILN